MVLPHPLPDACQGCLGCPGLLLEGGQQEANTGTHWSGASLDQRAKTVRLQVLSRVVGGGGYNRMLSFYWEINENEWK